MFCSCTTIDNTELLIKLVTFLPITKFLPIFLKPYFSRVKTKKWWYSESSAFSISIATKKPSNFLVLAISIRSYINLLLSPIYLFLTYAGCCEDIKSDKKIFSFSERAFDVIFRSTFNKEMRLQFFMNLISLSFFLLT